ncbi:MAG TPA: MBL fold metallo-hydrolase, partial [Gemmatimonadetes bacterium]|nr:MBL fold metallo-hydrolase [Gemmatimonadota bacterium]
MPIGIFCGFAISITGCASASPTVSGVIDRTAPAEDGVRLIYLGTGGWIFERGDDQVIAAPFFSNPGLLKTGLLPIHSDLDVVDQFMSRYDVSRAQVILVGHAHYDHLMDVPRIALEHAPGARILGSRTVKNTLGTWSGIGERVDEVNDIAGDQKTVGTWLRYGPGVRIMALRSLHAPHFEGYTLYKGTRVRALNAEPRWATEWLD